MVFSMICFLLQKLDPLLWFSDLQRAERDAIHVINISILNHFHVFISPLKFKKSHNVAALYPFT